MRQTFFAKNHNGQPQIAQSHALKEFMRSFGDKEYQITVEKRVRKRSGQQNKFYHGCMIPAVIDALVDNGYARSELNAEIVHEFLKNRFLRKDLVSEQGEVLSVTRSTTELSTEDFNIFIDDIVRWGAEYLNVVLSLPNEQSLLQF